jgi:hypothetical protein
MIVYTSANEGKEATACVYKIDKKKRRNAKALGTKVSGRKEKRGELTVRKTEH